MACRQVGLDVRFSSEQRAAAVLHKFLRHDAGVLLIAQA